MKFSTAVLVAVVSADDKKVPPRHPLQRLNRLTAFSIELLNDWYSWLPSKDSWVGKFQRNAERMARNYERCGYYDPNNMPHGGPSADRNRRDLEEVFRYDKEDPSVGTQQITTGFRKWAARYMAACSGQRKFYYQINRMSKWNSQLQAHLAGNNQ